VLTLVSIFCDIPSVGEFSWWYKVWVSVCFDLVPVVPMRDLVTLAMQ